MILVYEYEKWIQFILCQLNVIFSQQIEELLLIQGIRIIFVKLFEEIYQRFDKMLS